MEARYFSRSDNNLVRCDLCPHLCTIKTGKTGICGVRRNDKGVLIAETYGIIASSSLDPIEKKPLYHFHPGKMIYSIGSYGCNLRCIFCQNHEISQVIPANIERYRIIEPNEVVARAAMHPNNIGIAFTYNEPAIAFEYILETARLSKAKRMKNVMVTNGYINPAPLEELLEVIDGFNVDLKAFTDQFYKKNTGGTLLPVLESLKKIKNSGRHLEVTFLVIPGLNDDEKSAVEMFKWIANELGRETVLHLSRYYPSFRLTNPATPPDTLLRFFEVASQWLNFVYIGNVQASPVGRNTLCPNCSNILIKRNGYQTSANGLGGKGECSNCGYNPAIEVS